MKIYQLIFQGCALVLLTALPSLAETKGKKVILVPGENLFPIKCETIQGSIDANDRIDPPGSLHDSASRYDSYRVKTDPGNIVFFELTIPNQNNYNFNPLITTLEVDKETRLSMARYSISGDKLPVENPDQTKTVPHQVWYFSRKATENTNRNLYISSTSSGTYNLRIAYTRPSINLSESEVEGAIRDQSQLLLGLTH
ncbi:MAG: hypothetical protein EAZ87_17545 [Nostocales cyanobacterium]|nr:MAG: hypothetical protein EAZ87_17545 [Nostocales cyanobacterium]